MGMDSCGSVHYNIVCVYIYIYIYMIISVSNSRVLSIFSFYSMDP